MELPGEDTNDAFAGQEKLDSWGIDLSNKGTFGCVLSERKGKSFGFSERFEHCGASRVFLLGRPMSDILLRGCWKAKSSGRHYV